MNKTYFVSELEKDIVILTDIKTGQKTGRPTRYFSKTTKDMDIIGYNRTERIITPQTIKSAFREVLHRYKITTGVDSSLELVLSEDSWEIVINPTVVIELVDYKTKEFKIYLSFPKEYENYAKRIYVDWHSVFTELQRTVEHELLFKGTITSDPVECEIIFDFPLLESVSVKQFNSGYYVEDTEYTPCVKIKKISFTDRFNMENAKFMESLFAFDTAHIGKNSIECISIIDKLKVDLSKYKAFDLEEQSITQLLRSRAKVKLPKRTK